MVNIPTAAELKTRHPEFNALSDARVDLFITEASRSVDDSWLESDQSPAIIALASHLMSLEGEPALSNGDLNAAKNTSNGKFLKSRKVGDVSNEWSESSASVSAASLSTTASKASYRSTPYGSAFLKLMTLNHTGMRVV